MNKSDVRKRVNVAIFGWLPVPLRPVGWTQNTLRSGLAVGETQFVWSKKATGDP
jgi:hypothetical protein